MVVRRTSRYIVNHQTPCSTAIVASSYSPESFLASSLNVIRRLEFIERKTFCDTYIPNLKLNLLFVDFNNPCSKLNPDGVWTRSHKLFLGELVQQTRLA
jgi:hypothetical protein